MNKALAKASRYLYSGKHFAMPLDVAIKRDKEDSKNDIDRSDGCCVYAMFTRPLGDSVFAKVGVSSRPEARLTGVQIGCPVPIEYVLHYRLPTRAVAVMVEREIHRRLKSYRSSGEWFGLDMSSPVDKEAFHKACKLAMSGVISSAWKWSVRRVQR